MQIMLNQNTGSSDEFKYVYGVKPFNAYITGVFDTATLTLESQSPNGTWTPVDIAVISEPIMISVSDVFPFKGRFTISGEGVSTSLTIDVVGTVL